MIELNLNKIKECTVCHQVKPWSEFPPRLNRPKMPIYSYCKACASSQTKTYRAKPGVKEKVRLNQRNRYKANPEKFRLAGRLYEKKHREKRWERNIKINYGVTPEQYNSLLEEQKGLCKICGLSETGRSMNKKFCIDHNHITGEIRGILCMKCNSAIGSLKVDEQGIANLKKAIQYIEERDSK